MKGCSRCIIFLLALSLMGAVSSARAGLKSSQVTYRQGETVLQGYLVYDDAIQVKRPGVLIVHEWWGLNDHARSAADRLAKEGYVALAVDMYGEGKSTSHPAQAGEWSRFVREHGQVGYERFMAAHKVLVNHPSVDTDRIAAIGYCFGGNIVLTMAIKGTPLRGVVSFHGSLPALQPEGTISTKILVCHGAADPTITHEEIRQFQNNLEKAGADWQFIFYGGAKHSFTNPDADKRGMEALGYNRSADQRSWKAMLLFFEEILAR